MKRYIKFIFIIILVACMTLGGLFYGIVCCGTGYFYPSYQSVILDKYRILMETNEPKIVLVGGSSLAFGLDQRRLAEATGYKVANLGLHAGFGNLFISELSKANINEGDIVLLGYEHEWQTEDGFNTIGTDLVMSGIDGDIEMYKYIPVRKWPSVFGYLLTYADKKCNYEPEYGQYSRVVFDENDFQMINLREGELIYDFNRFSGIDISNVTISDKSIKYLKKYKEFVESKGASVYFIAPPMVVGSLRCSESEFTRLKKLEEEQIGIPYISNPVDYIFDSEYMNDSMWHCNTKGEKLRTEMLINDLVNAHVIVQ